MVWGIVVALFAIGAISVAAGLIFIMFIGSTYSSAANFFENLWSNRVYKRFNQLIWG